jgi:hypothetical protein
MQTSTRTKSASLATTPINVRDTQLVVTGMPPVNNYALGDGGIEEIIFAIVRPPCYHAEVDGYFLSTMWPPVVMPSLLWAFQKC